MAVTMNEVGVPAPTIGSFGSVISGGQKVMNWPYPSPSVRSSFCKPPLGRASQSEMARYRLPSEITPVNGRREVELVMNVNSAPDGAPAVSKKRPLTVGGLVLLRPSSHVMKYRPPANTSRGKCWSTAA